MAPGVLDQGQVMDWDYYSVRGLQALRAGRGLPTLMDTTENTGQTSPPGRRQLRQVHEHKISLPEAYEGFLLIIQ